MVILKKINSTFLWIFIEGRNGKEEEESMAGVFSTKMWKIWYNESMTTGKGPFFLDGKGPETVRARSMRAAVRHPAGGRRAGIPCVFFRRVAGDAIGGRLRGNSLKAGKEARSRGSAATAHRRASGLQKERGTREAEQLPKGGAHTGGTGGDDRRTGRRRRKLMPVPSVRAGKDLSAFPDCPLPCRLEKSVGA